ncbi:MAG: hypothetical protein GY859_39385, partial [Desulfobacterales bacterium]|nr:hypothetical protein [Desulfobacterales bacterium]
MERVEKAAVFIPIVSPSYLKSDRCARERHTFVRKSENRADAHILVVERLKIDEDSRLDEFKFSRPKRFWVREAGAKAPRVLGHPAINHERDVVYFERVVDISDDVKEILRHADVAPLAPEKIQEVEPASGKAEGVAGAPEKVEEAKPAPDKAETAGPALDDRPTVYLAEVPGDLLDARDDMERYLEQCGFRVAPAREIHGVDSDSFREAVKKELGDCRVFVQLLSGLPGKTRSIREG